MDASFWNISLHFFVIIVLLRGQEAGIDATPSIGAGRIEQDIINRYTHLEDGATLGNGIKGNGVSRYPKSASNDNLTDSSLKTDLSWNSKQYLQSESDISKKQLIELLFPLTHTQIAFTAQINNNPSISTSPNKLYRKSPHETFSHPDIRTLHSIRLKQTKRDKRKNSVYYPNNKMILKGQNMQAHTKSDSTMFNNRMPSSKTYFHSTNFHTNKNETEEQREGNLQKHVKEQRNLSATKILNKRNVIESDDIISEGNVILPKEKQQHKMNAFNGTGNGDGNGTGKHEENIPRKHQEKFRFDSRKKSDLKSAFGSRRLSIEVYKRLRDAVVLDWHISLLDKDQMSTCDVAYMKSDYSSDSERTKITEVEQQKSFLGQLLNVTTVKKYGAHFQNLKPSGTFFRMSYIPRTRSFVIDSLESNQEYVFQMTCVDVVGYQHISSVLSFKTATSDAPSYHEYNQTVLLKVNNAEGRSNKKQRMLPFSWLSQQHLLYTSRNRNKSREEIEEASVAAASPVASKSLPAIYSSAVEAAVVGRKNNVNILERSSTRNRVSPHFVLGISCGVVGLIIIMVTFGIAGRRYMQYRTSETRLWEQQVIQEEPTSNYLESSIQSNNRHGVLISSNILDDEYNQSRSNFDNETQSNSLMVRTFPPPYTETCPLSTLNHEDRYCPDQRINDGVLYQLDSQYLHQLLPSNANSYTNTISTNHICDRYRNNNRK